jgi:hypothetical protein
VGESIFVPPDKLTDGCLPVIEDAAPKFFCEPDVTRTNSVIADKPEGL